MNKSSYQIQQVKWQTHADPLSQVRRRVFIEEQHVPEELEWDQMDVQCQHVLAVDDNQHPIGTGRLCPHGHIGRMAVLKNYRGKGVGRAILKEIINIAQQTDNLPLTLNAQTSAAGFYTQHGFTVEGNEFMDAGIPHLKMTRS